MKEYTLKIVSANDVSPVDGNFWIVEHHWHYGIYDVGVPAEYDDYGVYARDGTRIHLWVHKSCPDEYVFAADFPMAALETFWNDSYDEYR